jgi:uridine phosphorylase
MNYGIAVALMLCSFGAAAQDKNAPFPEKIVTARTVFLQNETGQTKFTDNIRRQIEDWNRWHVVQNKAEADLVLSLQHKQGFHNYFYIVVLDRASGEILWEVKKDVAIGGYGGIATALLKELRKHLPRATDPQ